MHVNIHIHRSSLDHVQSLAGRTHSADALLNIYLDRHAGSSKKPASPRTPPRHVSPVLQCTGELGSPVRQSVPARRIVHDYGQDGGRGTLVKRRDLKCNVFDITSNNQNTNAVDMSPIYENGTADSLCAICHRVYKHRRLLLEGGHDNGLGFCQCERAVRDSDEEMIGREQEHGRSNQLSTDTGHSKCDANGMHTHDAILLSAHEATLDDDRDKAKALTQSHSHSPLLTRFPVGVQDAAEAQLGRDGSDSVSLDTKLDQGQTHAKGSPLKDMNAVQDTSSHHPKSSQDSQIQHPYHCPSLLLDMNAVQDMSSPHLNASQDSQGTYNSDDLQTCGVHHHAVNVDDSVDVATESHVHGRHLDDSHMQICGVNHYSAKYDAIDTFGGSHWHEGCREGVRTERGSESTHTHVQNNGAERASDADGGNHMAQTDNRNSYHARLTRPGDSATHHNIADAVVVPSDHGEMEETMYIYEACHTHPNAGMLAGEMPLSYNRAVCLKTLHTYTIHTHTHTCTRKHKDTQTGTQVHTYTCVRQCTLVSVCIQELPLAQSCAMSQVCMQMHVRADICIHKGGQRERERERERDKIMFITKPVTLVIRDN
jgi:hypothetical protein